MLRSIGRTQAAERFEASAKAIRADFQRLLVVDGVLTGYALFDDEKHPRYLLHPSDQTTGVHYSSLAMIHAILEDLQFTLFHLIDEVIGFVGSTGNADPKSAHLHFAIFEVGPEKQWWEKKAVNPYPALLAAMKRAK